MENDLVRVLQDITVSTFKERPAISIKYPGVGGSYIEVSIRLKEEEKYEAIATMYKEAICEEGHATKVYKIHHYAVKSMSGEIACPVLPHSA